MEDVEIAGPPPCGSWVGEGGSRSKSSSLRPNQSAPPFLGWMGLAAIGGLHLEPGSPLGSGPPSANNLTDCRRDCRPSEDPKVGWYAPKVRISSSQASSLSCDLWNFLSNLNSLCSPVPGRARSLVAVPRPSSSSSLERAGRGPSWSPICLCSAVGLSPNPRVAMMSSPSSNSNSFFRMGVSPGVRGIEGPGPLTVLGVLLQVALLSVTGGFLAIPSSSSESSPANGSSKSFSLAVNLPAGSGWRGNSSFPEPFATLLSEAGDFFRPRRSASMSSKSFMACSKACGFASEMSEASASAPARPPEVSKISSSQKDLPLAFEEGSF